jgi:hypothetical protein
MITILLLIRFSIFFGTQSEDVPFNLFTSYAISVWGSMILLNMVFGSRLKNYLKNIHYNKWLECYSFPGRNSFQLLRFIYSKDNLGDATLDILRKEYRSFIKLALSIFFTLPLLFITVMPPVAQLIESLFLSTP